MDVVLAWMLIFVLPVVALLAIGAVAATRRPLATWTAVPALVVVSTTVWLVYAGLYQHEIPCDGRTTGCPTIYGYDAPLPDEHVAGLMLVLAAFAIPALWVGWRRLATPATTGISLAVGPTVLAWWTAPRGDNDGLWILAFFGLAMLGGLAAILTAVAQRVGDHAAMSIAEDGAAGSGPTNAALSDRVAALAIDVALVGVIAFMPLTMLTRANLDVVAAVLGIGAATAYLALPLARKGRTFGQSRVGLFVVDTATGRPLPVMRAVVRSLIVVVEVAAIPTAIFAIPALIELVSLTRSGRTVTDRLLGTDVLSDRPLTNRWRQPAGSQRFEVPMVGSDGRRTRADRHVPPVALGMSPESVDAGIDLILEDGPDPSNEMLEAIVGCGAGFADACNALSVRVAERLLYAELSYEDADQVMNWVWSHMNTCRHLPMPEPAYLIYDAIDAGEYDHSGDGPAIDPVRKYTLPALEQILADRRGRKASRPTP